LILNIIIFKKKDRTKRKSHYPKKTWIKLSIFFFLVSRWIAWISRNTYGHIYKHIYTNHIIKTRYHKNTNHVIKTNTPIRYEFVTKVTLLSRPRICEKRDITQIRITLSNQNLKPNYRAIVWAGKLHKSLIKLTAKEPYILGSFFKYIFLSFFNFFSKVTCELIEHITRQRKTQIKLSNNRVSR